jgi:hypothetical protein
MNIEKALLDPTSVFGRPAEVFDNPGLSREEKIRILRRWEYDARELEVAEEENMGGGPPDQLDQVLDALHRLEATIDSEHSPPTKQGGE